MNIKIKSIDKMLYSNRNRKQKICLVNQFIKADIIRKPIPFEYK